MKNFLKAIGETIKELFIITVLSSSIIFLIVLFKCGQP